jgi:hypothetical protein
VGVTDGVTVYMAGGLGNQLFMAAAAWEQAERLACPFFIDDSHMRATGTWNYALEPLGLPGQVLGRTSPWTSLRVSRNHVYPIPRSPRALAQRLHLEKDPAHFDASIGSIKRGAMLVGYFQSAKYFPHVAEKLADALVSVPASPEEQSYLGELSASPHITLHLRRGDYVSINPKRSLVASVDYAVASVRLMQRLGFDLPVRVFCDSPDLVRQELLNSGLKFEFVDESRLQSPFSVLKAMAVGRAMVMSNSTFSWWGAWLMERVHKESVPVIAPRPWNEQGSARADLIDQRWISLDARGQGRTL